MDMKPVKSSNVNAVGYDPATKQLAIEFKGSGTYYYEDVPPERHAALMGAPGDSKHSVGRAFHSHIKPHHPGTKKDK